MAKRTLEVDLPDEWWARLDRLVAVHPHVESVDELLADLLDHLQQSIYRSGSWERLWLAQCVPEEAIEAAYDRQEDPRFFGRGGG
jgi:hypothetical protein